jgi:hypothetical protein
MPRGTSLLLASRKHGCLPLGPAKARFPVADFTTANTLLEMKIRVWISYHSKTNFSLGNSDI